MEQAKARAKAAQERVMRAFRPGHHVTGIYKNNRGDVYEFHVFNVHKDLPLRLYHKPTGAWTGSWFTLDDALDYDKLVEKRVREVARKRLEETFIGAKEDKDFKDMLEVSS